jgi:hypothetical protein
MILYGVTHIFVTDAGKYLFFVRESSARKPFPLHSALPQDVVRKKIPGKL